MECTIRSQKRTYMLALLLLLIVISGCGRSMTRTEQDLACSVNLLELEVATLKLEKRFLQQELQFCNYNLDYVLSDQFADSLFQEAALLKQMAVHMQEHYDPLDHSSRTLNTSNIGGP